MTRLTCLLLAAIVVCGGLLIGGCHKKTPGAGPEMPTPVPTNTPIAAPTELPTPSPEEMRLMKLEEARGMLSNESIYFDYDQAMLTEDARSILAEKAGYMINNPDIQVVIEGHCDERGSNEYNLALGERRAAAARKYLVNFGVNTTNIDTVTFGEERPVCRESGESCWKLNRRAAFVVSE
ncbi:peptidoglycan-associated lipoprotein Pal [bacterium]|nr:peptidoglycan-associated lipoprotein Pal [candidate division CSSED10-310 bacterium]